jgi:hypothetical protein
MGSLLGLCRFCIWSPRQHERIQPGALTRPGQQLGVDGDACHWIGFPLAATNFSGSFLLAEGTYRKALNKYLFVFIDNLNTILVFPWLWLKQESGQEGQVARIAESTNGAIAIVECILINKLHKFV